MSDNRAFWKAFQSLTHPLSLLAILLLLFNDHWLRYAHPSWLTGKLGDFTWLLFAPFITGLLFAWIVPRRLNNHIKIIGMLSIGFIGVWFATAKTIPFVHHLTTETLYAIVGWEGQLRLDITDLLTLPALIISWYIWKNASDSSVSLKPLGYVALGLGLLGTMASDGSVYYDRGITCICNSNGLLIIQTRGIGDHYNSYESSDGGLNWKNNPQWNHVDLPCSDYSDSLYLPDKLTVFQWTQGQHIFVSKDGGETWKTDYVLDILQQEVRTAYHHYESEFIVDKPGPRSAYFDVASGNVIFAMGWNGVLVRGADANYIWLTVGDYGLDKLFDIPKATQAIFFELWLSFATILLIVITSIYHIRNQFRSCSAILIIILWLGHAVTLFMLLSERYEYVYLNGASLTSVASFFGFVFFGIPLSIGAVWDIARNFRSVALNIALAGIGNGLLFIFPFLLWTQGRIPRYVTAYVFSVMLTALGLYATQIYLRRILPTIEPEKLKNDAIEKDKKG